MLGTGLEQTDAAAGGDVDQAHGTGLGGGGDRRAVRQQHEVGAGHGAIGELDRRADSWELREQPEQGVLGGCAGRPTVGFDGQQGSKVAAAVADCDGGVDERGLRSDLLLGDCFRAGVLRLNAGRIRPVALAVGSPAVVEREQADDHCDHDQQRCCDERTAEPTPSPLLADELFTDRPIVALGPLVARLRSGR